MIRAAFLDASRSILYRPQHMNPRNRAASGCVSSGLRFHDAPPTGEAFRI